MPDVDQPSVPLRLFQQVVGKDRLPNIVEDFRLALDPYFAAVQLLMQLLKVGHLTPDMLRVAAARLVEDLERKAFAICSCEPVSVKGCEENGSG